ncbi:MAG: pssY [Mucilaginibacter sp.]|nr:pssY [Mucilaginibacter sp.]
MNSDTSHSNPIIALVGFDDINNQLFAAFHFENKEMMHFANSMNLTSYWADHNLNIVAVISQSEIMGPSGLALTGILKKKNLPNVPLFLIVNHLNANLRKLALNAGIVDVFKLPLKADRIEKKITFIINNWDQLKNNLQPQTLPVKSIEFSKRAFDIFFAGIALLIFSPILLIIYTLIRLESKGPAFYYSLRVGTGYRVFKFYKFRSMFVNADKRIKDFKHLNQYNIDGSNEQTETALNNSLCAECMAYNKCQYPLYADNINWCEKDFMYSKKANPGSAFFKIKNDPRITRVGNFIRNTSIDELPQLWNVIIGDMSIVGNRPLPLYEAEKLTTDKYVLRFSAPAGITGLWQVEKRGKGEMSEEDRLMLDNVYAQNHSFKNDIKLIIRTIPALLQKENV